MPLFIFNKLNRIKKYTYLVLAILLPSAILLFYYMNYGSSGGFEGSQCTIHYLTGLNCPGCGGQRTIYALMHGRFIDALRYNSLLVFGLPFLIYMYYYIIQVYVLKNEKYVRQNLLSTKGIYIFMALLVLFTILRNIPIEPFIYLSPSH